MTIVQALACFEAFAAVVMLWAALTITATAGISTQEKRWMTMRRLVYCLIAAALFALGTLDFNGSQDDGQRVAWKVVLIAAVIFFPLLRAFHVMPVETFFHWRKSGQMFTPAPRQSERNSVDRV